MIHWSLVLVAVWLAFMVGFLLCAVLCRTGDDE